MEEKIKLMNSLLDLYEQYESIQSDSSAATVEAFIKSKENRLANLLLADVLKEAK